ncbi:hypothetical protein OHA18_04795 [Kribbella sp. NBC_00709]|uniref:hypothetical protein n=1 Tax=Kribbella sp. NBC_00709 TaxID=2975972 RepID=UPI002E2A72F7|nr:hypothetical protein [Kribbella sp. NBC_00709]
MSDPSGEGHGTLMAGDGQDPDDQLGARAGAGRGATYRRGGLLAGQACLLIGAGVGVLAFGWVGAGLSFYLTTVDPRGGIELGKPLDPTWAALVLWMVVTLVATTGLPRRREGSKAGGKSWRRARGGAGAAVVQGVGGAIVIGGTLLGYLLSHPYTFGGSDTPCTSASCWPQRPQALALTVPGLAAGLALIVMAFLVNRLPWWIRAVVPAAVWLLLLSLQYGIWDATLLPIFQGPPR